MLHAQQKSTGTGYTAPAALLVVGLRDRLIGSEQPTKLRDEAWGAWLARNRAQDLRRIATRMKMVKWVSVATLVGAIVFVPYQPSYEVLVRFVLTLCASVVMWDAFKLRDYTFATVFGTLALIYNPVLPVMNFSGFWQCALMILSAVLFIVSLTWGRVKLTAVQPVAGGRVRRIDLT